MECVDCGCAMTWNSDIDGEDADGNETIESFWSCSDYECDLFMIIIRTI